MAHIVEESSQWNVLTVTRGQRHRQTRSMNDAGVQQVIMEVTWTETTILSFLNTTQTLISMDWALSIYQRTKEKISCLLQYPNVRLNSGSSEQHVNLSRKLYNQTWYSGGMKACSKTHA